MNRYEEDDIDALGWLIGMLIALGFLFGALVFTLHWMGVLA